MTSDASGTKIDAEIDALERQLNRRDWLFRASFFIPLLSIVLFVLVANSYLRKADAAVTDLNVNAEAAGIAVDDPSGIGPARAIGRFAATARDVRPLIPYPRPAFDPDGTESSRAIRLAVEDLSRVKQLVVAEDQTVQPGSIPHAVETLLERCEVKPPAGPAGAACADPPESEAEIPVFFSFGRADLTPDNRKKLRQFVETWRSSGRPQVMVAGYTDSHGGASYNDSLRARRAETVRRALEKYSTSEISFEPGHGDNGIPKFKGFEEGDDEYRRVVVVSFVGAT